MEPLLLKKKQYKDRGTTGPQGTGIGFSSPGSVKNVKNTSQFTHASITNIHANLIAAILYFENPHNM